MKSLVVAIAATLASYGMGRIVLPDEPPIVTGGALFLGLIIWTSVEKLWGKPTDQSDGSNMFPLLFISGKGEKAESISLETVCVFL